MLDVNVDIVFCIRKERLIQRIPLNMKLYDNINHSKTLFNSLSLPDVPLES